VRKVVRVWLPSTLTKTHAYIPGIGHKLQKFSTVLIRGGRTRDLPGMYYKVIRGKYDAKPVWLRRRSISKYGVRNYYMFKKKKRWKQKI
jgi:small subunit ribosomal protein S12